MRLLSLAVAALLFLPAVASRAQQETAVAASPDAPFDHWATPLSSGELEWLLSTDDKRYALVRGRGLRDGRASDPSRLLTKADVAALLAGRGGAQEAARPSELHAEQARVPLSLEENQARINRIAERLGGAATTDAPANPSAALAEGRNLSPDPAAKPGRSLDRIAVEQEALKKVVKILSQTSGVKPEEKAFLREWVPRAMRAGLVGREPTPGEIEGLARNFPKLGVEKDWRITGDMSSASNCIAWSVGNDKDWLWPGDAVKDFDAFYEKHGFVPLKAGEPETDADVALWADKDGPTHASRRVAGEWWESKVGGAQRILHRPPHLEGDIYGKPVKFYRRIRPEDPR